jgi:CRP/FNR family cyclic AMP-dependent transcriptional regulator
MGSPHDSAFLGDCLFKQLEAEGFVCALPARAILFMEGDVPRGVHVVLKGHVKLTVSSREGRVLIIRIIDPGEVLGLHNCITGAPYEMTAQTLQPCRVNFVKREDLLRMLRSHPEVCLSATRRLSQTCHDAYSQVGSIKFSHSASEKLARFLLALSAENEAEKDSSDVLRVEMDLTHDEIAQAIGASRETVTRALATFRKKQLANLTRTMLLVKNRAELEKIAGMAPSGDEAPSDSGKREPEVAARASSTRWLAAWGSGRQAS